MNDTTMYLLLLFGIVASSVLRVILELWKLHHYRKILRDEKLIKEIGKIVEKHIANIDPKTTTDKIKDKILNWLKNRKEEKKYGINFHNNTKYY